jgi:poly(3-hydroxybutyrate) depolymerase
MRTLPLATAALAACGAGGGSPSGGPEPTGCISDVSAGKRTISCAGLDVDIDVPSACLRSPCGLILDVHGAFLSGALEDSHTRMRALGEAHGYIVVQPTAPVRTVDFRTGPLWNAATDDAAVVEIMTTVASAWHTDPRRTHFMGFSQGGFMTWRFVCNHADLIASAAPAAAGNPGACGTEEACDFAPGNTPSQPVDILFVMGRHDYPLVFCMEPQHEALVEGMSLTQSAVVASDPEYEWIRYTGPSGMTYERIAHDYETDPTSWLAQNRGHCVPGSTAATGDAWDALACKGPCGFSYGEAAMQFFIDHPRRP